MESASGTRFGTAADTYHRLRPVPPPMTVDWMLGTDEVRRVVEFGAGTGLFTAPLVDRATTVYAVEPDPLMRGPLMANCPEAIVLNGTAEHLPLAHGTVDAAVSHSAWHWVDPEPAFREIHRVLVPGGLLAVSWTTPDRRIGWRAKLDEITGKTGESGRGPGRFEVPDGVGFEAPEQLSHPWTMRMTVDDLVASLGTYDHVLGLSEVDRNMVLTNCRTYLNGNPATSRGIIEVPFVTVCFRTHRH